MLHNANIESEVAKSLSTDILIVGAGTMGLFIADCLIKLGIDKKILIIDSGDNVASLPRNPSSTASIGKIHNGVTMGRAQGLGGTSTLWGGQLVEFDEVDISRSDAPWPISYAELSSLYHEVYKRLDVDFSSQDFYRKMFGGEVKKSIGIERFFTRWLKEPNFARLFRPLILSGDVSIITNLTAYDITFSKQKATGVSCISGGGRVIQISSHEFIFAAGTIATNQFFLSTKDGGEVPWRDNINVGHYFQDHLGGQIASVEVLNESRFRDYFENCFYNDTKLQPKLKFSNKERDNWSVGASGIFSYDSSMSQSIANIKQFLRSYRSNLMFSKRFSLTIIKDFISVGRALFPIARRFIKNRRIFALMDRGVLLHVQSEQIPIFASCITLAKSKLDKDRLFPVQVDWKVDGRELKPILELAIKIDHYLQEKGIGRLKINEDLLANDPKFLETLSDTYHQCGGLRMSKSESEGVVDEDCLVWGTHNVWVAGAPVMPSSSFANCTLTALALSYKVCLSLLRK